MLHRLEGCERETPNELGSEEDWELSDNQKSSNAHGLVARLG